MRLTENEVLLIYVVIVLVLMVSWFTFVRRLLDWLFPHDASLCDDSLADADSSSSDRRDTF
jgi:hypothetical protein